jgi:hypothetical protein
MNGRGSRHDDDSMYLTYCTSCGKKAVWVRHPDYKLILERLREPTPTGGPTAALLSAADDEEQPTVVRMVHPRTSAAPPPNEDIPVDTLADYKEAASVLALSPRSSAALLRLCLQKLCVHFGQPGKNINDEIGALVAGGTLRPMIQQAMDTVRIAGNESVHPGELNLNDDRELALALFGLVNLIADEAITQPRKVKELYDRMPEGKRSGVAQRDAASPAGSATS